MSSFDTKIGQQVQEDPFGAFGDAKPTQGNSVKKPDDDFLDLI